MNEIAFKKHLLKLVATGKITPEKARQLFANKFPKEAIVRISDAEFEKWFTEVKNYMEKGEPHSYVLEENTRLTQSQLDRFCHWINNEYTPLPTETLKHV